MDISVTRKEIAGSYLEELFDLIIHVCEKHGGKPAGWKGWSTLNGYYPCHLAGNFIKTNEHDDFSSFISDEGKHPVLGGGFYGDSEKAFEELKILLDLELVDDRDCSNSMTYPGHREKYWRINNPKFAGSSNPEKKLPRTTDGERFSQVIEIVKELTEFDHA